MASTRFGFFDRDKHLGKLILEYLPDAIAKLGIDTSGFQIEGDVNCCMIKDIPNSAIVNAIKEGLGLRSHYAPLGYNLIDRNRRNNLYWLRVDYKRIGMIARSLVAKNKDSVKENIVKLILEKSSKRAEQYADGFSASIDKHKLSGRITEDLATLKTMTSLSTIEEVIACNALIKTIETQLNANKMAVIKNPQIEEDSVPQRRLG